MAVRRGFATEQDTGDLPLEVGFSGMAVWILAPVVWALAAAAGFTAAIVSAGLAALADNPRCGLRRRR